MDKAVQDANALIEKRGLRWISVNYTDILGHHRSLSLPAASFTGDEAWEGIDFDGSSVGMAEIHRSDMTLMPDPCSFKVDPFSESTGLLMANILDHDGSLTGPRGSLVMLLERYRKRGLSPFVSPEMEFYVYESVEEAILDNDFMGTDHEWKGKNVLHSLLGYYEECGYQLRPTQAYHSAPPKDTLTGYRDRLSELLMGMGYRIRYHHHEVGRRQQEIETGYYPALEAADYLLLFKYLAKYLGVNSGLLPTFMPKPSSHDAGNGMHFHFFLRKGARNAFNSGGRMSKLAMSFVAGLLEHAPGLCAFTNPTVNSYRRLLPDFEAPVVIGWSRSNRSALIRVPASAKEEKTNVEIRSPDPSADPYFASTAMLAAGLDGIGRKLSPPEEGKGNLYESGDVRLLPKSLEEALEYAGDDEVLVKAVGEGTFELYRKAKLEEVESHRRQVPVWDFNMYYGV